MNYDYEHMLSGPSMVDYHYAMACIGDPDGRQFNKLKVFVETAHASLHKHFSRWMSHLLLPAALLSEPPLARVVACAMRREEMPTYDFAAAGVIDERRLSGRLVYPSLAHGRAFCLIKFHKFLSTRLNGLGFDIDNDEDEAVHDVPDYSPEAQECARLLTEDSIDLRSKIYDEGSDNLDLRVHMHKKYLPLPCHTQFVESAVKDAKEVSATDRSEEHRSWMAVIRSATPRDKADKNVNMEKIKTMMNSAIERAQPHMYWIRNQVDRSYDARFNTVVYQMKNGHFKQDRIDKKKDNVVEKGAVYKKQNAIQVRDEQQLQMPAVTGFVPYGKLTKARNMTDLEEELLFRHIPIEEIPSKVNERREMLRVLEFERLIEDEKIDEAEAMSKKVFKVLSGASFNLID